jgi:hypothetical protein
MAAPPPDGSSWSFWETLVTALSSGGLLAALEALRRSAHRDGRRGADMKTLRTDLDNHIDGDKAMFAHLEARIAENAAKQDLRHEENIRAIGALPDKADWRDLRDQMNQRFAALESLVRARGAGSRARD